jgi:hypothetical protein
MEEKESREEQPDVPPYVKAGKRLQEQVERRLDIIKKRFFASSTMPEEQKIPTNENKDQYERHDIKPSGSVESMKKNLQENQDMPTSLLIIYSKIIRVMQDSLNGSLLIRRNF